MSLPIYHGTRIISAIKIYETKECNQYQIKSMMFYAKKNVNLFRTIFREDIMIHFSKAKKQQTRKKYETILMQTNMDEMYAVTEKTWTIILNAAFSIRT